MPGARLLNRFIRFFYSHFYNRLAFTYDPVSGLVSRGEWREWTRAAIPFARGPRILEVAFGPGNLQLDLRAAGFSPFGIELSPYMVGITRAKLRARGLAPALVRGRAQALPFRDATFDSIIMTFPRGFISDRRVLQEFERVLAKAGCVLWVDAPYLFPRDPWSRFLNWALSLSAGQPGRSIPGPAEWQEQMKNWETAGWNWRIERVERPRSLIHVIVLRPPAA